MMRLLAPTDRPALRARTLVGVLLGAAAATAGCDTPSPCDPGEAIFRDPKAGGASLAAGKADFAPYSCAFCHDTTPTSPDGITRAGGSLANSAYRTSYWGGKKRTLREAATLCSQAFMRGNGFLPDDPEWLKLDQYLVCISAPQPSPAPALAMSLPKECNQCPDDTCDLCAPKAAMSGGGGAENGAAVYDRTCKTCHGDYAGEGKGQTAWAPHLTRSDSGHFMIAGTEGDGDPDNNISHVSGKIRFGSFSIYGIPGGSSEGIQAPPGTEFHLAAFPNMPPYSRERLTPDELVDLLAYLGPFWGAGP